MQELDLYQLSSRISGVSKAVGDFLAEAAHICLEMNGHQSGISVNVSGHYNENVRLIWNKKLDKDSVSSWRDIKEATEYGATAISLLLITHFGKYKFVERLPQLSIGDFFLKRATLNSNNCMDEAFLEISGIFKATSNNTISIRITQKRKQLNRKYIGDYTVLISIIEFSTPKAKIVRL